MAVFAPQGAQGRAGEIGQGHQSIFMALATANMHLLPRPIDVTDFQRQRLAQAQAHRIGREQKDPVTQLARRADQLLDLGDAENIRQ